MVNQKILDYIKKVRDAGYTDAQIRQSLINAGWSPQEIDQALASTLKRMPKAPPPKRNLKGPGERKTNSLAIIAFILAFIFSPAGLILGIIALTQINHKHEKGKGLAIAAIIISLVLTIIPILAAIAFFGILDPARLLVDKCEFQAGMDCIDKASITDDSITVALRNNMGSDIRIDYASSSLCSGTPVVALGTQQNFESVPAEVPNMEEFRIRLDQCNLPDRIVAQISVSYTNLESQLQNEVVGEIRTKK
jgi:hypothetical protein